MYLVQESTLLPLVNGHESSSVKVVVRGVVQGVGFRPFCYRIAKACGLRGHVLNSGEGVELLLSGETKAIKEFLRRLVMEVPPLSHIESLEIFDADVHPQEGFKIKESEKKGHSATLIPPDISICNDCLRELLDPTDRRYLYPFINCTNCGPRYTIIESLPYDRPKTTMAAFEMCDDCAKEYKEPADRRFHAEPTCCPTCGPGVALEKGASILKDTQALKRAAYLLRQGQVLAIKGLGGFHIACDAFNPRAVKLVRNLKKRPTKPLAIMVRDISLVKHYLCCTSEEEALLVGYKRPIVLVKKRPRYAGLFEAIAPNVDHVGVMLPYTPLHYLLMAYYGAPEVLVMTSANKRGEPIVKDNYEAKVKLKDMVDAFLLHDRPILRRVDDSVTSVVLGKEHIIRRARGYVPAPIRITGTRLIKNVVAFGADLKNTACIGRGSFLFLSQHIGDLDSPDVQDHLIDTIEGLKRLLDVDFDVVVTDMHPDYHSARLGEEYAKSLGIELKKVQHHFAHLLQVVAEHNLQGQVLGCILDGTGYGLDGNVWGGEILYATIGRQNTPVPSFVRLGHLEYLPLPGGDIAAKEPWRMAMSALWSVGAGREFLPGEFVAKAKLIEEMIDKGINSPLTSSAGRLFDAVASLLGIRHFNDFEGQAAMELEATARRVEPQKGIDAYPVEVMNRISHPWIISSKAVIGQILADLRRGVPKEEIALRFHLWFVSAMTIVLTSLARAYNVDQVVLSGGVFQNRLFLERLSNGLRERGLDVFTGETVPVNDGGIALGQAYCGGLLSCV